MAATPPAAVAPGERLPTAWRRAVLAALVLVFLAIGLHRAGEDAPTVDEGVDVSSGLVSLVHHDLRMVPEHPALPKALAALPALLAHPIVPETPAYRDGDWFQYSDDFMAANEEAGRLDDVLWWIRVVPLLESVGCALLLYVLARRWFGPDGGLLAAGAWLTTPYVVGLSAFAMIDVAFTLAALATAVALARWFDVPSRRRTVELGLVLGLALATRHTALVLVAVAVVAVAASGRRRPARAATDVGLVGLTSVAVLWLVYRGLAPSAPSGAVADRFDGIIGSASGSSALTRLVTSLPLPEEWRAGFAYLDLTSTARPSALLGRSWDGGRWWYFPASAVLKLPLTLVAAVVGGWIAALRRPTPTGAGRRRLVGLVAAPAFVLWLFLATQPLNLGLRLALPVVAFAFVGLGALAAPLADLVPTSSRRRILSTAGSPGPDAVARAGPDEGSPEPDPVAMADRLASSHRTLAEHEAAAHPTAGGGSEAVGAGRSMVWSRVAGGAVAVVVVVQLLATVAGASHPLAWSPPPFTPGYRWVSDANLDAGQGLYEVRAWAEDHDRPFVALDSTRGLSVGGDTRSLRGVAPADVRGWVAVGITPLVQTRRGSSVADGGLAWLRKYCPVGTLAGGSVLVYRFDGPPDPAPGPPRPAAPCEGDASSSVR